MPTAPLHYYHVLFSIDGSITPLIPTSLLPSSLTILPPADPSSIVPLQEYSTTNPCPSPPPRPPSSLYTADSEEEVGVSEDDAELIPPCQKKEKEEQKERQLGEQGEEKEVAEEVVGKGKCVYFRRRDGCKRGDACRFVHALDGSEERKRRSGSRRAQAQHTLSVGSAATKKSPSACPMPGRIVDPTDPKKSLKTHCTFFLRFGECDFWPECRFSHDQPGSDGGGGAAKVFQDNNYSWGKLAEGKMDKLEVSEIWEKGAVKEEAERKQRVKGKEKERDRDKEKRATELQWLCKIRAGEQLITLLD